MGNSQSCLNLDGLAADGPSSLPENRLLLTPSMHFHITVYYNTERTKVKSLFPPSYQRNTVSRSSRQWFTSIPINTIYITAYSQNMSNTSVVRLPYMLNAWLY